MIKNLKIFLFLLILNFLLSFLTNANENRFEAETAKLLGDAYVTNSTFCSEGRKVINLGSLVGNGEVEFDINIEADATYMLHIYYLAGDDRSFDVLVNKGSSFRIDCPATESWDIPGKISKTIQLVKGKNLIRLGNNYGYAPDLDRIIVEQISTENIDSSAIKTISFEGWTLNVDTIHGSTSVFHNQKLIINNNGASFKLGDERYFLNELQGFNVMTSRISDSIGNGEQVQIIAQTANDKIMVKHNYFLYAGADFFLTDLEIESDSVLSSNYMCPVLSSSETELFPAGENLSLWVPFDNDKWVRYSTLNFGVPLAGYEVSVFFNNETLNGLVTGSVEHNVWKTGILADTKHDNKITRLEIFGGVTSNETRDVLQHGAIKGKVIRSPKIMVGYFGDWRRGMETFADVNEKIAPRLPWNAGKPFGWNSWGALQTSLSYTNADEVSQYFADHLQNNNFSNDSTVYIGLDSYWSNISYSNLFRFVKKCRDRGQNAGIYWTPFVDWSNDPNRLVEGSENVRYGDIYLYANGQTQKIAGANAIDPTHPAARARAKLYLDRFIDQGFTYLKLDFLTHGALESDAHYDATVTTGIQAYNQGLKFIADYLQGKMFINLSIAPLFPTQYAHSRRIACDAYSSINDTEYTLNSLSYGWWLDHMFTYNDADNVVLNGVSLGENRARVTSSVITGIFIVGDNFSSSGYSSAKTRAETYLTNPEVNRIARLTKAFYPIKAANGNGAANMFMQQVADTTYLAVFNYETKSVTEQINFGRIGLDDGSDYIFHELWGNEKEAHNSSWEPTVPRRDVKLFKIYKGILSSVPDISEEKDIYAYPNPCSSELHIGHNQSKVEKVFIYNIYGQLITETKVEHNTLDVSCLNKGFYILKSIMDNGDVFSCPIIKD